MFRGGEEDRWSSWGRFNSGRVSFKVGLTSIAQSKEQTFSKRQVPGLNPGRGSITARCIGSRLYRVEMITYVAILNDDAFWMIIRAVYNLTLLSAQTVVGYTLVQLQPPRQKNLDTIYMDIDKKAGKFPAKALRWCFPLLTGRTRIVTVWPDIVWYSSTVEHHADTMEADGSIPSITMYCTLA